MLQQLSEGLSGESWRDDLEFLKGAQEVQCIKCWTGDRGRPISTPHELLHVRAPLMLAWLTYIQWLMQVKTPFEKKGTFQVLKQLGNSAHCEWLRDTAQVPVISVLKPDFFSNVTHWLHLSKSSNYKQLCLITILCAIPEILTTPIVSTMPHTLVWKTSNLQ